MAEQKHTDTLTDLDKVELYKLSNTSRNYHITDSILKKINTLDSCNKQFLLSILRAKSLSDITVKHNQVEQISAQYYDIRDKGSCFIMEPLLCRHVSSITLHSTVDISHIMLHGEKIVNTNSDLRIMHYARQKYNYIHNVVFNIYFTQNTSVKRARVIIKMSYYNNIDYDLLQLYYTKCYEFVIDDKIKVNNKPIYKEKIHNIRKIYDCALSLYPYQVKDIWLTRHNRELMSDFAEYSPTNLVTLLIRVYEIRSLDGAMRPSELQMQIQAIREERLKNLQNSDGYARLYKLMCECCDVIHEHESKQLNTFMKQHISDQAAMDECTKWLHSQRNKVVTSSTRWFST